MKFLDSVSSKEEYDSLISRVNPARILGLVFTFIGFVFTFLSVCFWLHFDQLAQSPNMYGSPIALIAVFFTIGMVFLTIGIVFLITEALRKKTRERLIEAGYFIYASVTEITFDLTMTVNGRNPYIVFCEALHPFTCEKMRFKSNPVMERPQIQLYQKIRVFLDAENPKDYYVETTPESEIFG